MRTRNWLLVGVMILATSAARADDPLRFVPARSDVVVKIDRPRALLEAVENHPLTREALKLAGIREFYDSTNQRRLHQLIAHFEKELGKDKYQLLDALAGGGVVFAAHLDKSPAFLLVIQATDEAILAKFVEIALDLAEKERVRLEVKAPLRRHEYRGCVVHSLGPVHVAITERAFVVASDERTVKAAIDAGLDMKLEKRIAGVAAFREARDAMPKETPVWAWLNLDAVKAKPEFKTGFDAAVQDPNQLILFGGLYDVLKRSPCVSAHVALEEETWRLRVRMPRGREGMSAIAKMLLPEKAGESGILPTLRPPRTLASFGYFLDLGEFWDHRAEILNAKAAKDLDAFDKESPKILFGAKVSALLKQMGTHHRIVVAGQEKSPYRTKPGTKLPAFAAVIDTRDPKFAKTIDMMARGYGLVGVIASGAAVKLGEQQHAGKKLVCFHFHENKAYDGDATGYRFNFSPCFVDLDRHVIFSSTVELAKDLIDELERVSDGKPTTASVRSRLFAEGAADALKADEEQVLTQLILNQALAPTAAREEVGRLIALVRRLGEVGFDIRYEANEFLWDARWRWK